MENVMTNNKTTERAMLTETLRRMAVLAEYTNPDVAAHIERVAGYSQVLALGCGLSEEEAQDLADACRLHDIGMIGVPTAITQKIGQPTHDEWEIIKTHPEIGARLLAHSEIKVFQLGELISLTHHERWDGSGYPAGLKGDEIPLAGQICAISDVFDMLTTERTYKQKISPKNAAVLIEDSSGNFFDPDLVEVFMKQFDQIAAIRTGLG